MKTYLVTGGAGFIGSNFVQYMLQKYQDVRILNLDKLTYAGNLENLASVKDDPRYTFIHADICDKAAVEKIFAENDVDYVVNFAAESHVDRSIREPEVFVKTNVEGTVCLLNAARNAWNLGGDDYKEGCKYLQVSTDEVYGSLGAEGFFTETTPLCPHSPYSASKAAADMLVQAYFDTFRFPVNITRCSNNYGPYQFPEKLIPLMIHNCQENRPLPVYGDGMQVRDWLYVEDHCRAIDTVLQRGRAGEVYNIGGNNEKANIEIVRLILSKLGKDESLITHVKDRPGHDRRYAIDNTKITTELGWHPQYSFEKGMSMTIDWYLEHTHWMEHVTSGAYRAYYDTMYR